MTDRNRYANFKEILNEINEFVKCPELLKPLDDKSDRKTDQKDDDELARQLDIQLSNVLLGANGSSICDSESLELSEFSSEDDDDEFDAIVEQLQNKSSLSTNENQQFSMPTLSSLFTCEESTTILSKESTIQSINKSKNNDKRIKKFAQHQSKINYALNNESSARLFDKIIRNNFHQKSRTLSTPLNSNLLNNNTNISKNLKLSIDLKDDEQSMNRNETIRMLNEDEIETSIEDPISKKRKKKEENKNMKNQQKKVERKSKSEIFTLKSRSTNSTLENLLNSIRSK